MDRAILGNENLSRALESFQSERDAELALLEERRMSSEEATAAAHAAAIQATHEANEVNMRQVRYAADAAVREVREEIRLIKDELEKVKKEKMQTRRSLDEAISRLQASQEDVVDRSLMKNVLLDWFARSGKSKEQVLEMMASLLHFSEDEKEKIHLYDGNRFSQVISSVATLPPATVDVQNLEGANVRDKFVNFLLAETDD
ncbi:biological adhesion [Fragilaria crotonensis]|nr:biological adhesion [Fragilaria crotonensis]